jgi:putative drug exporter of the RND superfamily
MGRRGIAERIGGWSARHARAATLIWFAFVAAAIGGGSLVAEHTLTDSQSADGQSARAEQIIQNAGFPKTASESVLVQSRRWTISDPAFRSTVSAVVAALNRNADVHRLRSPLASPDGRVSRDGHSALVEFDLRGDQAATEDQVPPILAAVDRLQRDHPAFTIGELGDASAAYQLDNTIGKDFKRAELLTVPVTLVVLLFAFGALVAAGVPVLLAFSAVLASIGLARVVSHVIPASDSTSSIILLIGMAVGVDYSLFYLRREREEAAALTAALPEGVRPTRRQRAEVLRIAAATSGRAVLVSGVTVMVAMAGMLLVGDRTFTSIGVAAMLVVFAAMVGSLTVLPAVLSMLGERVERGRIPLFHRLRRRGDGPGAWTRLVGAVNRRPLAALVVSGGTLVALAVPAIGLRTQLPGFDSLPSSIPVVATYDRIQAAFPGAPAPAVVVVRAPSVRSATVRSGIARLERAATKSGEMSGPFSIQVNPRRTVALVTIPLHGDGENSVSTAALHTLRDRVIPRTIGAVPGTEVAVTGETAGSADFNAALSRTVPMVFAFVLGLAFLLLVITFRSLVISATAIVLNLLSVAAAYGILVLVFQHGVGGGLVGLTHTTAITSWLPLFLFVILFGLSMDYHVFIVSRIKELHDRGMPTTEAVATGITATSGTVTSAAAVMVGVFAIFASLSAIDLKQVGVGLAAAILLDATVVRGVLLPATMTLLGERNWYLPGFLRWLPQAHAHEAVPTPAPSMTTIRP